MHLGKHAENEFLSKGEKINAYRNIRLIKKKIIEK